jgi:hypothetical protein
VFKRRKYTAVFCLIFFFSSAGDSHGSEELGCSDHFGAFRQAKVAERVARTPHTRHADVIHWVNTRHFDLLTDEGVFFRTNHYFASKVNGTEVLDRIGQPYIRTRIGMTEDEAQLLAQRVKEESGRSVAFSQPGITCSGTTCVLIGSLDGSHIVPSGVRLSPTLSQMWLNGRKSVGDPRVLDIQRVGQRNFIQSLNSYEVRYTIGGGIMWGGALGGAGYQGYQWWKQPNTTVPNQQQP